MIRKLTNLTGGQLLLASIELVAFSGISLGFIWTIATWIQFHMILWLHLYHG